MVNGGDGNDQIFAGGGQDNVQVAWATIRSTARTAMTNCAAATVTTRCLAVRDKIASSATLATTS